MVLWEEYRETHPAGYGYSRFCDLFREFERRVSPVMRQDHRNHPVTTALRRGIDLWRGLRL
jgi:transposase